MIFLKDDLIDYMCACHCKGIRVIHNIKLRASFLLKDGLAVGLYIYVENSDCDSDASFVIPKSHTKVSVSPCNDNVADGFPTPDLASNSGCFASS